MDIEQRLARLEDRAAINDLVVRYFLASDDDERDIIRQSFTPGATFSASGTLCGTGPDGIADFIASARGQMGLTIHTPHYAQISFERDDRARGLVGAHLELVLGDTPFYGAVRYVDTYAKVDGTWLFASRDMRTVAIGPTADFAEVFASPLPARWNGAPAAASDYPRKT